MIQNLKRGGESMRYVKPQITTMEKSDIESMVAECVTCPDYFRCGTLFKGREA